MNPLARFSLLLFAVILSGLSLAVNVAIADELPDDTNKIESLTPGLARKLVEEFPGVEVEVTFGHAEETRWPGCLPLNGLKSLDIETAKALAGYVKGPLLLNGLTTLDAETAKALAEFEGDLFLNGLTTLDADIAKTLAEFKCGLLCLGGLITLDARDSVAIAKNLATREGPLSLFNLKQISPKTIHALIAKKDVDIPPIETLELIPEPDGSATEDFVIPEWLEERQRRQRAEQAAE